jgi:hypothetical protein
MNGPLTHAPPAPRVHKSIWHSGQAVVRRPARAWGERRVVIRWLLQVPQSKENGNGGDHQYHRRTSDAQDDISRAGEMEEDQGRDSEGRVDNNEGRHQSKPLFQQTCERGWERVCMGEILDESNVDGGQEAKEPEENAFCR